MRAPWPLVCALLLVPLAQAAEVEVRALGGAFEPSRVQARAGDAVLFVNADDRAHTVTSAWDDGASLHAVLKPGQSVRVTFAQAGTYPVRCVPHSTTDIDGAHGMVVTVDVAGAAAQSAVPRVLVALAAVGGVLALALTARAASTPLRRWWR